MQLTVPLILSSITMTAQSTPGILLWKLIEA